MPRDTRDRESVPHPYLEPVGRSGRSEDSNFRRKNDRDSRHNKDEDRMTKRDNSWGSSSYREDRRRRSRSRSKSRSRSISPPNRAKSSSANSSADVNSRFSMNSGIQMKLLTPAATSSPTVRNKSALPVPSSTSSSTTSSNKLGTTKLKVASIFNDDDDDDEPEEMPAECRMRMKNVGRETPTSAGPNSFGKTKIGFCNVTHITEKKHND